MTTIRRQAGPTGATLRARPSADAPVVLHLPAGTILEGELVQGEELYGDGRYLALYMWLGRTEEPVSERLPRAHKRRKAK